MPIRTKPWSEVTFQDVEELIAREVREDATLEFKQQLNLSTREERSEFLKDVSAMANSVGGTIIFGALEGSGDQSGQVVSIQGQAMDRDAVELQITNILRDGLDERLFGVLFKALPTSTAGEYVCVLRIPASPLAPHRITTGKPVFYARGSVSNEPMTTRQIREMILQRETAVERAQQLVEHRTRLLEQAGAQRNDTLHFGNAPLTAPDQVVLHVIPLFPHVNGWQLGPGIERRLMSVRALGAETPFKRAEYSQEGMASQFPNRRKVLFLRKGGLEFQRYEVLNREGQQTQGTTPQLKVWEVELDILRALKECAALTDDGLLPLPVLVSVRLLDVGGSRLQATPVDWLHTKEIQSAQHVYLTPVILNSWGADAQQQIRALFDELWQAWHQPSCQNYYPDGRHHEYDPSGNILPWSDPAEEDAGPEGAA